MLWVNLLVGITHKIRIISRSKCFIGLAPGHVKMQETAWQRCVWNRGSKKRARKCSFAQQKKKTRTLYPTCWAQQRRRRRRRRRATETHKRLLLVILPTKTIAATSTLVAWFSSFFCFIGNKKKLQKNCPRYSGFILVGVWLWRNDSDCHL